MRQSKIFLLKTLAVVSLCTLTYLTMFWISTEGYVKSEWWVKDVYRFKEHVASQIEKPKIIIAGGSNALFGINSAVIEGITGYPVANMAVHAALDIDFLYYKLVDHVKEGDIVVMPLENGTYVRGLDNEWFINNMISWGYDDYLRKMPIIDLLEFVFHTPKIRVYNGVLSRFSEEKMSKRQVALSSTQLEIIKDYNKKLVSPSPIRWRGHDYRSLNRFGDFNVPKGPTSMLLKKYEAGIPYVGTSISEHFFSIFQKIERLIADRKAKLILTWPVSIRNNRYDLSIRKHQNRTESFKKLLSDRSIEIHCNPALFNLDVRFFFSTVYHPNRDGALIRSTTLATCIDSLVKQDGYKERSFEESIGIVKDLEVRY